MSAADPDRDPLVQELREEIAALDRAIVEAINRRVELVGRLKEHKAAQGWEFVDRAREERMLADLARSNAGPLSSEGLRDIYAHLLELTKREV
jgi:chorismate mutase